MIFVFYGRIEGIDDLVTFEGQTTVELINAFHETIDDYIALCKKAGKEPLKSCKGSFSETIGQSGSDHTNLSY